MTGAEALYADLGHFGRGPIRMAWLVVVLPALALNYLGQGALVLADPKAIENPFFLLYPGLGAATDGGARDRRHRDRQPGGDHRRLLAHAAGDPARPAAAPRDPAHLGDAVGQIYMPRVNWLLLIGVLLLVRAFRSSSALAAAYGIAVTGTMVATAHCWRSW